MSAVEPSTKRAGLAMRAVGMLLHPGETWAAVAAEPIGVGELYRGYIAPLAAIAPICGAAGLLLFGASIAGIHLKPSLGATLLGAGLDYGLTLIAAYLLALAVAALAPAFGGTGSRIQALKLVAYAGTATWLAGVFALYPTVGFPVAVLGGLYSLYALYLGLSPLMRTPPERSLTYFAVILFAVLLLALLLRLGTGFVR
ncbi:MAG: hypothetical protein JWP86_3175 [Phenylobacterium sp.]|nr:hypothetical protein [Phenylobacterium sp.]